MLIHTKIGCSLAVAFACILLLDVHSAQDCTFENAGTNWWQAYEPLTGKTLLRRYYGQSSVSLEGPATSTSYECEAAISPTPFDYYIWKNSATNEDMCVEEYVLAKTIFFRTGEPSPAVSNCKDMVSGNPSVAVKSPFDFSDSSCVPLRPGTYQVMYSREYTGENYCQDDSDSIAFVTESEIVMTACYKGFDNSYVDPIQTTFQCIQRTTPSVYGGSRTNGDIFILTANFDGVDRFYCAHFKTEPTNMTISLSLDTGSMYSAECNINATHTTADLGRNIQFTLESYDCGAGYCLNGATCVQEYGDYTCICAPDFTGIHCETDMSCPDNYCENGGTCTMVLDMNMMDIYTCDCPPYISGDRCQTPLGCPDDYCDNGTCVMISPGNFECMIVPIPLCDSEPCWNGGTCIEEVDIFSCSCPDGFTGVMCGTAIVVDPCASNPCPQNTTCKARDNGDHTCTKDKDDDDFPWLPIVIAIGVFLGLLLLALLVYCCMRYCRRMGAFDDKSSRTSSRSSTTYMRKPYMKPAPRMPPPQPIILPPPMILAPPEPPKVEIWRSDAVFTPGLQYPHVVVGDYPLEGGNKFNVAVPFVDGTMEEHPGYIELPTRPIGVGPVPSIVASLGPAQGRHLMTSQVRGYVDNTPSTPRPPMVIQELDDSGHVKVDTSHMYDKNGRITIGEERHVSYDTLPN